MHEDMGRDLLGAQASAETTTQYCYPNGLCSLSNLQDGITGFAFQGTVNLGECGQSVNSAGDINGDGLADILIGAPHFDPEGRTDAGAAYVMFGSKQTGAWHLGAVDLSNLTDGRNGFVLQGGAAYENFGRAVSSAGDVNGDGLDDLLIGAQYASPPGFTSSGRAYVIFGSNQTNAWGTGILNITSLVNGQRGFTLQGEASYDYFGFAVSSAGDINGDNLVDMLIGAVNADPFGRTDAGKTYVVFGSNQTTAWSAGIYNISSLMNGQRGFALSGEAAGDACGYSLSSAGDVNADGLDDFLVGASQANSTQGIIGAGKTYVIFGSNQTNAWNKATFNISSLVNGQRGFMLQGGLYDISGSAVSGIGDINGDDIDDIVIGASYANVEGRINAGKSCVVFGSNQTGIWGSGVINLNTLMDGQRGFALYGEVQSDSSGYSVSGVGDINGDGLNDVMVGTFQSAPPGGTYWGKTYIVFGSNQTSAWNSGVIELSSLNGAQGFVLQGDEGSYSSLSIHGAGDVNGDSFSDILIGAPSASTANGFVGKAYLIFGVSTTAVSFSANNLRLIAGETVRLNNSMLALSSNRVNTTLLPLTVQMLEHGDFSTVNAPGVALTRFYPQNVSDSVVQFVHDGSSIAPAYRLLTNVSKTAYFYSDAQINFLGFPPVLVDNQLYVDQGLATTLQQSDLSATDRDDDPGSLNFILSNVQHGEFNLYNATGQLIAANISQFSQQAIFDYEVRFLHDGSPFAPSYDAAVTDFLSVTSSKAAVITFNHAPQLTLNSMIIDQGQPTILRPEDISATDVETFNEDLIIEVSNITHGYFSYTSNPNYVITAFRQYPLITGGVQFTQDGSNANVSFSLRAFDGRIYSPWQLAQSTLNRRPVLANNATDIPVEQGKSFQFDLPSPLFVDPDGNALNYSAQLEGGAPLPIGVEFTPPNHFQGKLSELTSLQIEVQAKDPRGLAASTDFVLESNPPTQGGINLQALYTGVSTIAGVTTAIAGYLWWRRRVASHRRGFELANNLRKAANLEYHDFMRFDGDIYKSKIENLLNKLDEIQKDFYKKLSPEQKKSFAVCIAEILEQHKLLSPSDYGVGIYGWILAFSVGWSQQLNFKQLEAQLTDIAQEAITAWKAEEKPTTRWPYFSPTCKDKAKASCCPRPSRAGMFAQDRIRLSRSQDMSMTELKHQPTSTSSKESRDEISLPIAEASSSTRLFGGKGTATITEERAALIEKQLQNMSGNIKTINERVEQLHAEVQPLLQSPSNTM